MANGKTNDDPCGKKKTAYDRALTAERVAKDKFHDAWRALGKAEHLLSRNDYLEVRRNLSVGDWPDILGSIHGSGYPSTEFFRKAKAVYKARLAVKKAQEAATDAGEALKDCKGSEDYIEWLRKKNNPRPTSACNAPCTSPRRLGELCRHMLTEKRVCPNHGPRPEIA